MEDFNGLRVASLDVDREAATSGIGDQIRSSPIRIRRRRKRLACARVSSPEPSRGLVLTMLTTGNV